MPEETRDERAAGDERAAEDERAAGDERAAPPAHRGVPVVVRYVLGVAVGVVVLLLLFGKRGEFVAAWHELGHVRLVWLGAAIMAEALSLWTFAVLQHVVLRASGTTIAIPGLWVLALANDAIACSVPGEPAVSSAYRYRYYRRSGASGASAGWTIFTILVAQAVGMALILLLGVLVALAASLRPQHGAAANTGVAIVGLVIVAGSCAILIRRDLVLRLVGMLVRAARRITGYPRETTGARIERVLERMREIPLSRRATAQVIALATAVWGWDFGCLLCAFYAVHAAIPWEGVLLAFGAAQIVAVLPIVPGGIGLVEGSLAVILAAYGTGRVSALSTALVFRGVSFWLAIILGWICVALITRQQVTASEPRRPGIGTGSGR